MSDCSCVFYDTQAKEHTPPEVCKKNSRYLHRLRLKARKTNTTWNRLVM